MKIKLKGQSAIEYLTTYGWMLLVVAIVGGAIFTTVQNSSQIQSTSGLANADVQIENFGVTNNGLETELRAASADQIENVNISLIDQNTGETVYGDTRATMPVGDTETVTFGDVGSSENTNTYDVEIKYDTGGLQGLTAEGTITGRISINGTIPETSTEATGSTGNTDTGSTGNTETSAVSVSGGSITSMATTSTFLNSSEVICVGDECDEATGSGSEEDVSLSGDKMTGTLFTDHITDLGVICLGERCRIETGSAEGVLGRDSDEMNGSLNVTEIKPYKNGQICAGTKC